MKENTKTVFTYLKEHDGEKIIATDIAEATGLPIKSVRFEFVNFEVTDEEGNVSHKAIKFIQLTDKGRESTIESIEAEELAAAQAKLAAKNAE